MRKLLHNFSPGKVISGRREISVIFFGDFGGRKSALRWTTYAQACPESEPRVALYDASERDVDMRLNGHVSGREKMHTDPVWAEDPTYFSQCSLIILDMFEYLIANNNVKDAIVKG